MFLCNVYLLQQDPPAVCKLAKTWVTFVCLQHPSCMPCIYHVALPSRTR